MEKGSFLYCNVSNGNGKCWSFVLSHSLTQVGHWQENPSYLAMYCLLWMWSSVEDLGLLTHWLTCSCKVTATYLAMYCLLWKTLDPCLPSLTPGERCMLLLNWLIDEKRYRSGWNITQHIISNHMHAESKYLIAVKLAQWYVGYLKIS